MWRQEILCMNAVEKGHVVCKTVSKEASKWAADIIKYFYCSSLATDLWKLFLPLENTKVLLFILIQNRLFFNLLILFLEVSFSRIQVPNSRLWNPSKTAQISIFSLCLYHTLNIWIYANNLLLNTHFWYRENWSTKKNLLQYTETSFTLRATIGLHKTTFNKSKM